MPTDARYIFHEGDQALILDRRGRRYLITLKIDKDDQNHLGTFHHDDIIGEPDGVRIWTSKGHALIVVKPGMADYIRIMPRVATVVYPKDIGAIITYGDIFPGARVLEAGTGSGALTIALARAVGERGKVFTYDIREDMTARAQENLAAIMPEHPQVTFKNGDVSQGIPETDLDRIVLDLPEPWHVVPHAVDALVPGGVITVLPPDRPPGPRACRRAGGRQHLRHDRDDGDLHADVVRPWPKRPPRSPDDRSHRIHHHRPEDHTVFASAVHCDARRRS